MLRRDLEEGYVTAQGARTDYAVTATCDAAGHWTLARGQGDDRGQEG